MRQPFHILAPRRTSRDDAYLFGVVTAALQTDPITLKAPSAKTAAFQFELERQPLVAVLTYEALGRKGDALKMNRLALETEGAANAKADYAEVKANIARLEKADAKPGSGLPASLQDMRTYHVRKALKAEAPCACSLAQKA